MRTSRRTPSIVPRGDDRSLVCPVAAALIVLLAERWGGHVSWLSTTVEALPDAVTVH
jgi:hypothetical protein